MSGSKTTLDSARHEHGLTSHRQDTPSHKPQKQTSAAWPKAIDGFARGATAILAASAAILPGAQASSGVRGGRRLLECSQPGVATIDAFSTQLSQAALSGLPQLAGAVSSGNSWGMFGVDFCHERLGAQPGPVNLTYTFDNTASDGSRDDINNIRAVDTTQRNFVTQTFGQLSQALNMVFTEVTGANADQANLQVIQADATPAKDPPSTYSQGPGNGFAGQDFAQLVIVGDTLVDTLQGVGGALGLTTLNTGVVQNASLTDASDAWLSTVMGLQSTPCFNVGTFGAADWAALQAAYGLSNSTVNGTSFALDGNSTSGGLLSSASNNTLTASFDGSVVLNLGSAPGNISHIGDALVALAPGANVSHGDISSTQGGYLLGNGVFNVLTGGNGNTVIDPRGGTNNTVITGPAQNIVVLQNAPGNISIENFKLAQDKLGLQFITALGQVQIHDTSAQNGQVQLGFGNGQNVALGNISANSFSGLTTLNAILLQNFSYTLPSDCQSVPAAAPAAGVLPLVPTPGTAPAPAPNGTTPVVPVPGTAPAPAPNGTTPVVPVPGTAPAPAPNGTTPVVPAPGTAPTPAPNNGTLVPAPAPAPGQAPPPPNMQPPPAPGTHTPPSPQTSNQGHGSHLGTILGTSIGIPVGLIVIAGISYGVYRGCKGGGGKRRRPQENPTPERAPGPRLPPNQPRADGPFAARPFTDDEQFYELELPRR